MKFVKFKLIFTIAVSKFKISNVKELIHSEAEETNYEFDKD